MPSAVTAHIFHVDLKLPFLVAFVLSVAVTVAAGLVIERVAYRPLNNSAPINVVIVYLTGKVISTPTPRCSLSNVALALSFSPTGGKGWGEGRAGGERGAGWTLYRSSSVG